MQNIAVGAMLHFGWETFKKRPWFFIGIVVLIVVLSGILGSLTPDPVRSAFDIFLALVIIVLNIFIEMGLVAFAIKANDDIDHAEAKDLWHPQSFWKYVAVKILTGLITAVPMLLAVGAFVFAGTLALLLIIPAAIWAVVAALTLIFATYLVVDRNLGPLEALKESARLTKGHRWQLFLLALALVGINILGAIVFLVGLAVSVPVSLLAIAHAYRTLAGRSVVSAE